MSDARLSQAGRADEAVKGGGCGADAGCRFRLGGRLLLTSGTVWVCSPSTICHPEPTRLNRSHLLAPTATNLDKYGKLDM